VPLFDDGPEESEDCIFWGSVIKEDSASSDIRGCWERIDWPATRVEVVDGSVGRAALSSTSDKELGDDADEDDCSAAS
jgi:hypothetical protein